MKKYENIIHKINEILQPIIEMGKVCDIAKPIGVYIYYSNDHNPPHFHLGIKGGATIRIAIPEVPFENQQQIKNLVLPQDKELISAYQKYFKPLINVLKSEIHKSYITGGTYLDYAKQMWCDIYDVDNESFKNVNDVL